MRTGDWIELDVGARTLRLDCSEEELERRRRAWVPPPPRADRGYVKMYIENVNQADEGADLNCLKGASGPGVPRASH